MKYRKIIFVGNFAVKNLHEPKITKFGAQLRSKWKKQNARVNNDVRPKNIDSLTAYSMMIYYRRNSSLRKESNFSLLWLWFRSRKLLRSRKIACRLFEKKKLIIVGPKLTIAEIDPKRKFFDVSTYRYVDTCFQRCWFHWKSRFSSIFERLKDLILSTIEINHHRS